MPQISVTIIGQMSKSILIFGGGFNPPTIAHEAIIAACLELPQFDEVWLMPSGDRLDKRMAADDIHRLRLAEILKAERFGGDPRLKAVDFELKLPRPTETYQTSKALAAKHPDTAFWWVLGADAYLSMPEWNNGAELQRTLNLLVFDRGPTVKMYQPNVINMRLPAFFVEVSSTHARKAIADGGAMDNLISEPVANYIKIHNLYAEVPAN